MDTINILVKQLWSMWIGFVALVPSLLIALVVVLVTWIIARFATRLSDRLTAHTTMRTSLKELADTVISIGVWVLGLMIAAAIVLPGLTPGSLIAGLGIGTIAIGFAFQDIFQNFLAGVLIMLRKKMQIGDVIECEGITGKVEHISLRETHIRKLSNELTIVPNSTLFKNPVEILTDGATRRYELAIGVSYATDLDVARQLIGAAVEAAEGVEGGHKAEVFVQEFGEGTVNLLVRWWAGSTSMLSTRDRIARAIKRDLDAAGIEIGSPYVTNELRGTVTVRTAEGPVIDESHDPRVATRSSNSPPESR